MDAKHLHFNGQNTLSVTEHENATEHDTCTANWKLFDVQGRILTNTICCFITVVAFDLRSKQAT